MSDQKATACGTCRGLGYVGVDHAEDDDRCPDCTVWEPSPHDGRTCPACAEIEDSEGFLTNEVEDTGWSPT